MDPVLVALARNRPLMSRARALSAWVGAGPVVPAPAWNDDDVLQLTIGLDGFRPPVWRRVVVAAEPGHHRFSECCLTSEPERRKKDLIVLDLLCQVGGRGHV